MPRANNDPLTPTELREALITFAKAEFAPKTADASFPESVRLRVDGAAARMLGASRTTQGDVVVANAAFARLVKACQARASTAGRNYINADDFAAVWHSSEATWPYAL